MTFSLGQYTEKPNIVVNSTSKCMAHWKGAWNEAPIRNPQIESVRRALTRAKRCATTRADTMSGTHDSDPGVWEVEPGLNAPCCAIENLSRSLSHPLHLLRKVQSNRTSTTNPIQSNQSSVRSLAYQSAHHPQDLNRSITPPLALAFSSATQNVCSRTRCSRPSFTLFSDFSFFELLYFPFPWFFLFHDEIACLSRFHSMDEISLINFKF